MVDFPIFEEIKSFVYTNLESIFLVIVPFATLVGWLAERNNKRLNSIEENCVKMITDLKAELSEKDKRFDSLQKEFNEFKTKATKDIGILKVLLMKEFDEVESDDNDTFNYKRKKRRPSS